MATIGTATVKVIPDVDAAAFRDVAILVAGIRLYDALYHADHDFLTTLPNAVLEAYGDLGSALEAVRK